MALAGDFAFNKVVCTMFSVMCHRQLGKKIVQTCHEHSTMIWLTTCCHLNVDNYDAIASRTYWQHDFLLSGRWSSFIFWLVFIWITREAMIWKLKSTTKMIFIHTCYNLTDQLCFRLWSLQDNSGKRSVQNTAAFEKMGQEINILSSFLSQQQSTARIVSAWWIHLEICTKTSALNEACMNGRHQQCTKTLAPEEL